MSDDGNVISGLPRRRRLAWGAPWLAGICVLAAGPVASASAAAAAKPTVAKGFTITKVADAPKGAGNCDDLAFLDGNLFMACQNKTLSNGGGGNSTLVQVSSSGSIMKTWSLKGKNDGLNADPLHHRVIATLNEDAASNLATITPAAPPAQQVVTYAYTPDPRGASTPVALRTGGGTDQVSVDSAGHILVTGSHAGTKTGTAVFQVALTPPSTPTGTGTAKLSPTYLDNATAANGNTGKGSVKLALGDVDSGTIVPQSSPRFGGNYVVADQTASQLVFAKDIFHGTGITALKTPFGIDDLQWATSAGGTLYVVDKGPTAILPKVGKSALYKVTGPFTTNTVLATNDGVSDQVATVNLNTGAMTPFIQHLNTSKGLQYVDSSGTQTQLPLNGATAISGTQTSGAATAPATSIHKASSGSSNTGLIIGAVIVVLLLLGGGGYLVSRRPRTA